VLALKASLWSIIPIYGWAKYAALFATIARLAYGEARERPESVADAQIAIEPRKWTLLWTALLVSLIVFVLTLIIGIIGAIIIAPLMSNSSLVPLALLAGLLLLLIWSYALLWVGSRYAVFEMPIAIEGVRKSTNSLGRSFALTKGFVWRIQLIFFIAILVSIPIYIPRILTLFLEIGYSASHNLPSNTLRLIDLVVGLLSRSLIAPFWACIQALLYYDLRTRKEGIDLLKD